VSISPGTPTRTTNLVSAYVCPARQEGRALTRAATRRIPNDLEERRPHHAVAAPAWGSEHVSSAFAAQRPGLLPRESTPPKSTSLSTRSPAVSDGAGASSTMSSAVQDGGQSHAPPRKRGAQRQMSPGRALPASLLYPVRENNLPMSFTSWMLFTKAMMFSTRSSSSSRRARALNLFSSSSCVTGLR